MKTRKVLMGVLMLGLLLAGGGVAHADGVVIIEPPPGVPAPEAPNLVVKYHKVKVDITDQVATTEVDQVFLNDTEYNLEGIYIFPLPEEAAISEFAMYVDGERWEGEILPRDEARAIYEDIVRQRLDPALLEYIGRDTFKASIFPIEPGDERRVELAYSQILDKEGGLVKYVYPLDTERFSASPLEQVVISVRISSREEIKAIYSPSHDVAIDRVDEHTVNVSFEASDVLPDRDFELYYTLSNDEFGLNLLSYRDRGEDGFFLLLVAPQVEVDEREVVAKDVIFVLDTSGSMDGEKIEQAKEALEFILDHLNVEDRFNIVAFSTGVTAYERELQSAADAGEAWRFIDDLRAVGGTNIDLALAEALSMAEGERPQILIFLTDGLATEGVTDEDRIIANVQREASDNVRIFAFGVGDDVNTFLLDTISQDHRGTSSYVRPDESIEEEVSSFYAKVSTPLLADIELDFGDLRVEETYPYPLPDLFAGTQLVVVGRYQEGGSTDVVLSGQVNGEEQESVYEDLSFSDRGGEEFIPRLWATRKIGYLLNEIRLHGEGRELIDEIVDLSVRYGIMTPYTSFLVEEEQDIFTPEGREEAAQEMWMQATAVPAPAAGAAAVQDAETREALRSMDKAQDSTEQIKYVRDKVFVLRDGIWTDTTYDSSVETVKLGFGGEDYFALIATHPEWGHYFSVGQELIVVLDGTAYQVSEGDFPPIDIPVGAPSPETAASPWDFLAQLMEWVMSLLPV
ncbi:MAG TPA: VIT domain-containing protein [Anaerolineae bacterium]|nr:VIT domain-containing protein [Anaerolineae bacterium]